MSRVYIHQSAPVYGRKVEAGVVCACDLFPPFPGAGAGSQTSSGEAACTAPSVLIAPFEEGCGEADALQIRARRPLYPHEETEMFVR